MLAQEEWLLPDQVGSEVVSIFGFGYKYLFLILLKSSSKISGGTAIVGPNGIAFTHPRGLAIGGPGSKIYSVPESTDLEQLALSSAARQLNYDEAGTLVARGPAIYYNEP